MPVLLVSYLKKISVSDEDYITTVTIDLDELVLLKDQFPILKILSDKIY